MTLTARQRFLEEVQYVIDCVLLDHDPGPKTWGAWNKFKKEHDLVYKGLSDKININNDTLEHTFCREVQSCLGVKTDANPGAKTWSAWVRMAYAEFLQNAWHPMPRYNGADPVMSNGFTRNGSGPEFGLFDHLGTDHEYKEDDDGEERNPLWRRYHFSGSTDRLYYCPPVPILSIYEGQVEYAKWRYNRWMIKIDHGVVAPFGHLKTWSTHHKMLHLKAGQLVTAADMIATAGDTGAKGAPHLHQEGHRYRAIDNVSGRVNKHNMRRVAPFNMVPLFTELRRRGRYTSIDLTAAQLADIT